MPVRPRAVSRSEVGCISKGFLLSMIVALATDIVVLQGKFLGRLFEEGAVQT
jgi:hypothetical protein